MSLFDSTAPCANSADASGYPVAFDAPHAAVVGVMRSAAPADAAGAVRGQFDIALQTRHAGTHTVQLRHECIGPVDGPVVFVAGGISADRHVAASAAFAARGWLDGLACAGRALDPARCRIVSFDYIGADGTLDAPIDTADQADAIATLLDALGIDVLHAFVGYSYGALVGLQFAARHGTRLQRLVVAGGAHRAHPHASAGRALQRRIVALGQLQCSDHDGLSLARQLAVVGYRTAAEFGARFDAPATIVNGRVRVAAEDYLDTVGARFATRTPVQGWLRLSESIDLHRIDPARVCVPTTVVAVHEDTLVPLDDAVALFEGLGTPGKLCVLRSPYGHDAFLKEHDRIDAILHAAVHGVEAVTSIDAAVAA